MGIFSFLGDIAKSVVGGLFGGGGGTGGQQPITSPIQELAATTSLTKGKSNPVDTSKSSIKAAKQVSISGKTGVLEDPWQPTKDWYKDLGGEGDIDTSNIDLGM